MIKRRLSKWLVIISLITILVQTHETNLLLAQDVESWNTYTDSEYSFSIRYPSDWQAKVMLRNHEKAGIIEKRLLFSTKTGGVNIDIFPNPQEMSLKAWYENHQLKFMPSDAQTQENLLIAGEPALYTLDPGSQQSLPRHTILIVHSGCVYRIEYQAVDSDSYLDVYRAMLESLNFGGESESPDKLFELSSTSPHPLAIQVQDCCGYTDPNYNPYPCSQGNCTWWARYKRPDTGGQQYPYWGDAGNWADRAREEGFVVNNTPAANAVAVWSYGHVAYVEAFDGTTASLSDMDYGEFDCVVDRWDQVSFSDIEFIHSQDGSPPNTSITSGPNGWITTDSATFEWTGSDDQTSTGDLVYSYKLDSGSWSSWTGSTSKTYNNLSEGSHTFRVKAKDEAGNEDGSPASRSFSVDTADPDAPTIHPGCNASDSQWQNTCRDPDFSWHASDPNGSDGSGIDQYAYAWNASSSDNPTTWGDATSHDPGPIADADGVEQHYLHVKARDVAGNTSSVNTFGLWYDGSAPTTSIDINNGASTTNQTTVRLNLTTGDTGSGVSDVRLSHNGLYWSDWQAYADEVAWALPALDRRELPVYAQVRDGAGNLSDVVSDTIYLDLYPPAPHSANYRICDDVIDTGGSVGITSTSYSLVSAIGQPWATGAAANASDGFAERGGFLANLDGCRPITHTVTDNFDIPRWVIAAAGNLRGSASYQLGDTTGQPAASGSNAFTSTNYFLSSGFWGDVTAPECPAPLTGVALTGPPTGTIDTALTFDAVITPTDASEPLTTTWVPIPDSGQGTLQATYQWSTAGEQTVSVEVENCGGSFSDSHTVEIQEPTPVCTTPITNVDVTGPVSGVVDTLLTFEVSVTPDDATPPITYDWTPTPESGQGTTQAAYRWDEAGEKTITVAAENCGGALSASRVVSVLLAPPSGFGVSLNDGALYTNDPQVTVRTWAPDDITAMRLSNDGGYANDGWQAYQVTTTWEIDPYGDYVIPRTVYVWFKDGQNDVYGAHSDDIIYDPVPPTGTLSVQSRDGNQVTLNLDATDDNSGVAEMRVGGSEDLSGAGWEPFARSATVTLAGDVAYAQFRDHAGNASPVYGSDGSTSEHHIYLPLVIRNR